jgi:hypothetical protein
MIEKIDRLLGARFKKKYNAKVRGYEQNEDVDIILIQYCEGGAFFRISKDKTLKESVVAIKIIIKNEIELK